MKEKDYKLDFLRVISMFMVIIIHLANYYCRAYKDISTFSYTGAIVFNVLARVSVPIFFMISGALLLSKPYDSKKNRARVIKMIITTAIFTLVYFFWDHYFMLEPFPKIYNLLFEPDRALLWFLYAIIALYLVLPFTKCMVDNMDERLDKLFVILWLIYGGLHISEKYPLPIVGAPYYLGYFVIGYLIYKYKDKIDFKKYNLLNIIILVVSYGINIGLTLYFSHTKNMYYSSFLAYGKITTMLASISAFILIYFNLKNKKRNFINFASKYSFCVYLVHGMLLNVLMELLLPYQKINAFIGIPLGFIILAVEALAVSFILKKIPILKDYI